MASPHIIEERVVSTANTRSERFEETNLRILEEADVLLCLQVQGAEARPGGTADLLARARARKQHVLLLALQPADGQGPLLTVQHLGFEGQTLGAALPRCIQETSHPIHLQPAGLPSLENYVEAVKQAGSQRASSRRSGFQIAAGVVIGTHIAATAFALAH